MSDKQLVVFHIGPVQDFIASARRSHDLWFGSWLLSELAKAAALEIVQQNGNDVSCLVFPAPTNFPELQSPDFNVSNKIVALVTQSPATLGEAVHKALLKRLDEIRKQAYHNVHGDFDQATAELQVKDLLEFYWAACPLDGNYSDARKLAESSLVAQKTTREFVAVPWGDSNSRAVPKSSLDGLRESVIPESNYNKMTENQLRHNYGVRPGERLCGVGLLKRHGRRRENDRFLSTSHIAALPLLCSLKEKDKKATDKYFCDLRSYGISSDAFDTARIEHAIFGYNDGHLLFEERLREFFDDRVKLVQAKDALHTFLNAVLGERSRNRSPIPYYALLLADGDNMGKAIDHQQTDKGHRDFSKALADFAASASKIVTENKGSLVYSGGDDVLAFIPLHTVLACAKRLAEKFHSDLTRFPFLEKGVAVAPSLSVGVVITHHLEPLSDALTLVRAAEKAAKQVAGKNALAVIVSKRSGSDRTVAGTWGKIDQRLDWFIKLHRDDAVPDAAAYELLDLDRRLGGVQLRDARNKEALRILRRKEAQHGHQSIAKDILDRLEQWIIPTDTTTELPIRQLADELIVAREFANAMDQANMPLPTHETAEA
jgi:CRISPR-associated protein Cmr2